MKRPITLALALSLTASLGVLAPATAEEPEGSATSAILLIGDGMSLAQIYSAEIFAEEVLGSSLAMPGIVDNAVTRTHSADSMVTDSAAAGTAIHSGYKTDNGAINVLPDGAWTYTLGQAAPAAANSDRVHSTARTTHAPPAPVHRHPAAPAADNRHAEQRAQIQPEAARGGGARHVRPHV